jgi:hypothetical protein
MFKDYCEEGNHIPGEEWVLLPVLYERIMQYITHL